MLEGGGGGGREVGGLTSGDYLYGVPKPAATRPPPPTPPARLPLPLPGDTYLPGKQTQLALSWLVQEAADA